LNEKDLINRLRQKDEESFRWLVEHYRNRVFSSILNIVQNKVDAEDAAQEVFIQIYESISEFKEESSLSTWIYKIAVRKAIDKLRRRKTRQRLNQFFPGLLHDEGKETHSEFHHPGIALENKEKASALFKAISSLPEKQRLAFTLIKVHGMSYDEAGLILQQSIKAMESLISRAKVNLQKRLEKFYRASK
jgi:RNA polymerase sigma-70 factor (ECF subfamily)